MESAATEPSDAGGDATSATTGLDGGSDDASTGATDSGDTSGGDGPSGDKIPYDPEQLGKVCARNNPDPLAQMLCQEPTPAVDDLVSLWGTLGMADPLPADVMLNANSSSLVARFVSAVNPRAFVVRLFDSQDILIGAFVRGEPFVEFASFDVESQTLNFYLLPFYQACSDDGCSLADLLTPAIEENWTQWSLYQDIDLENNPLDCLACHQPRGPGTEKMLRMQEVTEPWLHWFPNPLAHSVDPDPLVEIFEEAHGDEARYAGVAPATFLGGAPGLALGTTVIPFFWGVQGGVPGWLQPDGQPHAFDSLQIASDLFAGHHDTWDGYFEQVRAGTRIPVPSYRADITDPVARDAAIASYLDVMSGAAAPDTLLDVRDIFSDDAMRELSFVPQPGATAPQILHQMCQRCHNDTLNQTITRANFSATDPAGLTDLQKANIVARITLPEASKFRMPPSRAGTLPPWAIDVLVEYLQP